MKQYLVMRPDDRGYPHSQIMSHLELNDFLEDAESNGLNARDTRFLMEIPDWEYADEHVVVILEIGCFVIPKPVVTKWGVD